ncbi:pyruvate ferredoxin oxidoreductase [endosymbiont of Riftia pachyptila]|uniref:pyruvate ferredoxin oxidoreductase n=1 Tax=endosymbiont of Riftia pachyptila TaxID=54396 RepID=UPI001F1213FA|nr:pyruvate ferredoxin oxidoreductase [endosymbiont of Riftia pachyptila]
MKNDMPAFTNTAIKLYRKLFGTPAGLMPQDSGIHTLLDGASAIAITEACIAENAAISNRHGTDHANLAWLSEESRQLHNVFGEHLSSHSASSARGALASAIGLASAGRRATLFLDSGELSGALDLLQRAVEQRLPLVIHARNRDIDKSGSSHQALQQLADSGCLLLVAGNVQEAVDFALIARRVAEASLTPAIIAIDSGETANALQDVQLLSPALIQRYIGETEKDLQSQSAAERLLFGEQRPPVPSWHNLDRPSLQSAHRDGRAQGLSRAANATFLQGELSDSLEQAFNAFNAETGRNYSALFSQQAEQADQLIILLGSTLEPALQAHRQLNKRERKATGLLALKSLRPLPETHLLKLLQGKKRLIVMERAETPLAGDPPLLRELRQILGRGQERGEFSGAAPRLESVIYGCGGFPLRSADLTELLQIAHRESSSKRYLGIDFTQSNAHQPKRQVLLDSLRRDYPEIESLGLRARQKEPASSDPALLTLAVDRPADSSASLLAEAATLIHSIAGGYIRSRLGEHTPRWGERAQDSFCFSQSSPTDPGDEAPLDLLLVELHGATEQIPALQRLRKGGILLLQAGDDESNTLTRLPARLQRQIRSRDPQLFLYPAPKWLKPEQRGELALGALCATLAEGLLSAISTRKFLSSHEQQLKTETAERADSLLRAFNAGLESVRHTALPAPTGQQPPAEPSHLPAAVRHLQASGDRYDSLPRFWDQAGILYRQGEQAQLTPDPYLASGVIPPLSATFNDHSGSRTLLPVFDPAACTACGDCWSNCPDSAIGSTAISPTALINAGIGISGADALRPMASKLGARISARGRKGEFSGDSAQQLIHEAFDWLQQKAPLAEERREAAESALARVEAALGCLPLAITETLFHQGEKLKKDGGELLTLTINPEACKACGLCIAVCEPQALTPQPQDQQRLASAQQQWQAWEQLPDTPSETIERVAGEAEPGPMGAQQLSRYALLALASGDTAEAGSGEKIALRQILGTTEFRMQPLLHRFAGELEQLQSRISGLIRETLVDALPSADLDALSKRLEQLQSRSVEISELIDHTNDQLESSGVDAVRLARLTRLAQKLSQHHWQLVQGPQGLGRARYGIALAPGSISEWAATFPLNPFQVPVSLGLPGATSELAMGLLQGQLATALQTLRLVHQAKQELGEAGRNPIAPQQLTWDNLSAEERALCPPLLLIGSEEALGGEEFSQIASQLNSGLPIKVILLAELDGGLDQIEQQGKPLAASHDARTNLGLMALAQRSAFVAQCSIADPSHLHRSLRSALDFSGPALMRLHAPSPLRHGFASDRTLEQARLAVRSRSFPLFSYDPRGEGVFGSRLDLQGNPARSALLHNSDDGQPLTPAHWALTEQRFASRFRALADNDPAPTTLLDWLELEPAARQKKTPILSVTQGKGDAMVLRVDPELAQMAADRLHIWRTLQELAGIVTPFTARVEAEAEERVATQHQAELAALKADYEQQLNATRDSAQTQIAQQLQDRLMHLAGYR